MDKERTRYAKFRMYRRIEKGIMTFESVFFGAFLGACIWALLDSLVIGSFFGFVICLIECRMKRNSFSRYK